MVGGADHAATPRPQGCGTRRIRTSLLGSIAWRAWQMIFGYSSDLPKIRESKIFARNRHRKTLCDDGQVIGVSL